MTDILTFPKDTGATARSRAAVIAWCSILAGALSGAVMGLWSFGGPIPTPEWIGEYDSLARRFLRLAHIAMFALGLLHILVARQITSSPVSTGLDRLGLNAMAAGNVLMPTILIAAAIWEPLKYLTPLPTVALTVAFAVAALSAMRQHKGPTS